ncbi:alpha/beta fold hydrolase [Bradyrhizobium sp.]|uniref:alpha/beta fold hydrolase n=1 Tax=Bradyrhizobium sp. TaxID=376 RepID=UPI0025BE4488|nr:alpha/beta fold hydrolase [Bradyrhizobium sp.]MBV8916753.1 LysM peptidoglycan-binding domain-containing protein [Bradyrhizobium sp.]
MFTQSRIAALALSTWCLAYPMASRSQPAQAGTHVAATGIAPAAAPTPSSQGGEIDSQPQPQARAYLFRGALGPIFSRGMDKLTDRLEQAGVKASVWEFTICRFVADQAIQDYRAEPAPIILIGHSMGGLCALTFAEILQEQNIPVSLVVTVDPAHASPKVPLNVERFINIFLSTSVLGGGDIVAEPGYHGHYASFDMKDHDEVTHINIDKLDYVHAQLVGMITEIAKVPATSGASPVPLRYVVPPDATVELWDSGTAQAARRGETLQKLAADNHVPMWSLMQANQLAQNAQLAAGQRIVVPRHLQPPAAAPTAAPAAASQQASAVKR